MMCDNDNDHDNDHDIDEDGFWQELASDIANGLNNENDFCVDDFGESSGSDLEGAPFAGICDSDPTNKKNNKKNTKPKKCDDSTSHYHCYCLRSTVFKHRFKNYVGFTTNPERRIKQHNGIIKHGGAWKTKRGGRPWEFVVLVAGFPTHKMALQFEWAWQHPGTSLLVRAAIGDKAAKTLQRKRGTPGQMCILKTLLELCPDLYHRNHLTLNFLERNGRNIYDSAVSMPALPEALIAANLIAIKETAKKRKILSDAADAEGLPPAPPRPKFPVASARVISSLSELPFWATRKQRPSRVKRRAKNSNNNNNATLALASISAADSAASAIIENTPATSSVEGSSSEKDDVIEIIENETVISKKESRHNNKGIGDLYRRCCDFDLLEDTSSSEDERENKNGKGPRSICVLEEDDSFSDSADEDEDENRDGNAISFLTASIQDIHMATSSRDSFSSSEDSDIDNFIHNVKSKERKSPELEAVWRKVDYTVTKLSNTISVEDDSSDDSFNDDDFLTRPSLQKEKSLASKTETLSLEEKIRSMMDAKEDCGEGNETDDSTNEFVPSLSLEETINDRMEVEDPPPSIRHTDDTARDPFVASWVTTRKRRPETKFVNAHSAYSSEKTLHSSNNDSFVMCLDGDESDDGGDSIVSSSVMSPSSISLPMKTKCMSIVDLCTP